MSEYQIIWTDKARTEAAAAGVSLVEFQPIPDKATVERIVRHLDASYITVQTL